MARACSRADLAATPNAASASLGSPASTAARRERAGSSAQGAVRLMARKLAARPGQHPDATVRCMKKTILIALAALGILAPAAKASTVSFAADGAPVVTAGDEVNSLGIQSDPTDETRVRFYEGKPGLTVTAPAPCEPIGDDLVSCPMPAAGVRMNLAGGDDFAYVSSDLANVPIAISGGAGNDWLRADT